MVVELQDMICLGITWFCVGVGVGLALCRALFVWCEKKEKEQKK